MTKTDALRVVVSMAAEYAEDFKKSGKAAVYEALMVRISVATEVLREALPDGDNKT